MPRPRMTTPKIDGPCPACCVRPSACSATSPTRIISAIIGEIDINRDGIDDRDKLRRMIEDAGGVGDFDFPPPEIGKPTGQLSARTNWYLCDGRMCSYYGD